MCILPNLGPNDLPNRKQTRREKKEIENIKLVMVDQLLEKKV